MSSDAKKPKGEGDRESARRRRSGNRLDEPARRLGIPRPRAQALERFVPAPLGVDEPRAHEVVQDRRHHGLVVTTEAMQHLGARRGAPASSSSTRPTPPAGSTTRTSCACSTSSSRAS